MAPPGGRQECRRQGPSLCRDEGHYVTLLQQVSRAVIHSLSALASLRMRASEAAWDSGCRYMQLPFLFLLVGRACLIVHSDYSAVFFMRYHVSIFHTNTVDFQSLCWSVCDSFSV